tara:strand:+ start:21877 stop:23025 length:1149 start_codon:yes stop_codon:yes gene_type:complete
MFVLKIKHMIGVVSMVCVASSGAVMAAVPASGHGALLYDVTQAGGPDSARTNNPGQWKANITAFNAGATKSSQISRLYPYSGDIEMYCTGLNDDCIYSGAKQNVFVYYTAPAGYGQDSVAAYRTAFPQATVMAIIDGNTKSSLLKALSYSSVGIQTADLVARTICADPNVDGVFFDLEPLDISSPGQFAFYKEISRQFASALCIDTNHPDGRVFGAFLSPHKISDWPALAAAFGSNGYAAVSGYDVGDVQPPVPVSMHAYTASVTGMLLTMDAESKKNKIPYTVVIPAASSFSEFNKFGFYDSSIPAPNFRLDKDYTSEGMTQIGYMKAARAIMMAQAKSPYFIGTDYWSWSQYKSPLPKQDQMLLPNIPEGEVVTYLQQYG